MKPYNNNVLLEKKVIEPQAGTSGIIYGEASVEYRLIGGHDELQNKQVFLKESPIQVEGDIYATPIDNIVAFTD